MNRESFSYIRNCFYKLKERLESLSGEELREYYEDSDLQDKKKYRQLSNLNKKDFSIKGGVYVLETKNSGEGWNNHFHALLDCDYIPQFLISSIWEEICGSQVVYIEQVDSAEGGLWYCTKYLSKPPELESPDQAVDYLQATHNLRLMGSFGSLHGIELVDIDSECENCGSTNLRYIGSLSYLSSIGEDSTSFSDPPESNLLNF